MTTNYYDTFSITNKFTGYFSDITVGEFFNTLSSNSCGGTAILSGLDKTARQKDESSSSETGEETMQNDVTNPEDLTAGTSTIEGKRGSENIGIAVFDDDKLCGELTAMETICHLLINNDIDSCIVSINNPFKDNKENPEELIDLSLIPSKKSKVSVKIENGIPHISVKINAQASILTLENNINYEQNEVLEAFSDSTKDYLEKQFINYFNKISKEYKIDIDCFCNKALAYFPTEKEWEEYNWSEKIMNAEFDIDVNINTISSMLLTKT